MKAAKRARTPLPSLVTDNTGGRPLNAKAVATALRLVAGKEIVERLQARKARAA